jgi:hypothetical protein
MFSEQAPILESSFTEYLESAENCELTVGGNFPDIIIAVKSFSN